MAAAKYPDVPLVSADASLLSCWEEKVKLGVDCSLVLKHSKGKVVTILKCSSAIAKRPANSSSSPAASSTTSSHAEEKKKKKKKKKNKNKNKKKKKKKNKNKNPSPKSIRRKSTSGLLFGK